MLWLLLAIGVLGLVTLWLGYQHWRDYKNLYPRPFGSGPLGFLVDGLDTFVSFAGGVALVVALDIGGFRSEDPPHGASAVGWAILSFICMLAAGGFAYVKLCPLRDIRRRCIVYACVLALIALCLWRSKSDFG